MKAKTTAAGKQIRLLRLAVTTSCNLRCAYCCVRKTGRDLAWADAAAAARLLLRSPGKDKHLIVYGGEPLLRFALVRRLAAYARREAARLGKRLTISLATNGTLLGNEELRALRAAGIKLEISLDGPAAVHDAARKTRAGVGSYAAAAAAAAEALQLLGPDKMCALLVALPSGARLLPGSAAHLYGLGFDNIYVQIGLDPARPWTPRALKALSAALAALEKRTLAGIRAQNFRFLNTVNRDLRGAGPAATNARCPFYGCLEVYPGGAMGFSPFLLNRPDNTRYVAGTARGGLSARYRSCRWKPGSAACGGCWRDYAAGAPEIPGAAAALALRDAASRRLAAKILAGAKQSPLFRRYVREARERLFE